MGAFTYPSGTSNPPDGQVAQILIDVDNDGSTDLTIAYSALKSNLAELISESRTTFWEAALDEVDTATLAGDSGISFFGGFALDGRKGTATLITQNDMATVSGSGNVSGDVLSTFVDLLGGDDTFTIDRAISGGTIWGDASQFSIGDNVTGGNDTITVSATSMGTEALIGDVGYMSSSGPKVLTGGNDIITVLNNNNAILVGDLGHNASQ